MCRKCIHSSVEVVRFMSLDVAQLEHVCKQREDVETSKHNAEARLKKVADIRQPQ